MARKEVRRGKDEEGAEERGREALGEKTREAVGGPGTPAEEWPLEPRGTAALERSLKVEAVHVI